jgi:hypothetical protein
MKKEMENYINDSEYLKDFIDEYFDNDIEKLKSTEYLSDIISEYTD